MGFRFWRRVRIAPGITLNLSKSGASVSFGGRGAKLTAGSRGGRATLGIPGTGLFYTTTTSSSKRRKRRSAAAAGEASAPLSPAVPQVRPEDRLTLGFFKRLLVPAHEAAWADGCKQVVLENYDAALAHLESAAHLADAAYLAGMICLKKQQWDKAARFLEGAVQDGARLGTLFAKYGVRAQTWLPITDEITAVVEPDERGVLLMLVEAYQRTERWPQAAACLERLRALVPDDPVVLLSQVELLWDAKGTDEGVCRRIVADTQHVTNESPIHTAILLYRVRALLGLGLAEAAKEVATAALRRRKDRSEELRAALLYARAQAYERLGQQRRARSDLEKIYAFAPDYEDVAARLGL